MAADYNGSSDVSKSSSSPISTYPVSFGGWVYADTTSTTQYAFAVTRAGNRSKIALGFNGTGIILLRDQNGTSSNTQAAAQAASGQWMHLFAVAVASNNVLLYKNGSYVAGGIVTSVSVSSLDTLRLGSSTSNVGADAAYWNGGIAHACFYDVSLTSYEIHALGRGWLPTSIRPQSLKAYYPLGGFVPLSTRDHWSGGYNLDSVPASRGSEPRTYHIGWCGFNVTAPPVSAILTAEYASFSLTGQAAAPRASRSFVATQASYSHAGQSAAIRRGYTLAAAYAAFAETVYAVALPASRQVAASQASFSLNGQSVSAQKGFTLAAESGSLLLSGSDAAAAASRSSLAESGSLSITGQSAGLSRQASVAADQGSYSLSGLDVQLGSPRVFSVQCGTFDATASEAAITRSRSLPCEAASLSLSGESASVTAQRSTAAAQASFAETGQDASLRRSLSLSCDAVQVDVTGQDVQLLRAAVAACVSAAFSLTAPDNDMFLRVLTAERPYVDGWSRSVRDLGSEFLHRRTSSLELQLESGHKLRRESRTTGLIQ